LWRRFAACCTNASGALAFVQEFGLLFSIQHAKPSNRVDYFPSDRVDQILWTANFIRQIIGLIDGKQYAEGGRYGARMRARASPLV
jgi:hypothetical protein